VVAGSRHETWLAEKHAIYGPYPIVRFGTPTDAVLELEFGKLDAVVADSAETLLAMRDLPFLENRIRFGPVYAQAIAFHKGDPLRDTVNQIQNRLEKEGTLAAIYEKWFKRKPPGKN
jgi:polar amino acid transport system substrate-binding protein